MIINRKSFITGKEHAWDMPVTPEQIKRWVEGELVQDVFPELTADEREFILSGVTPEEWESICGKEE